MLNINFTKKKFNKLLLSINKLIESFFNNISDYLKEFKKKNSRFEKTNKIIFISLSSLFILVLGYFLIPTIYDKNLVKIKLQNQIKNKYNIKVNFEDDISYALFPKPHFYANNLNIFQDDNVLINSKNTRIYISIKNFFSFDALKVKNILFKDNEFNVKKRNLSFFTNILNSNNSDNTIIFEDSIIFYKDISEDVIFLVDLNNLKFFYDLEKKYQLIANYKIFNLPFKLNLNHNKEKNFFSFILESKNIRLKIKNFFQYSNKNFNGNLEAQILNDIKYFIYDIKNNSLSINSKDNNFKGEIDLRPFYLSLNLNFNEFDVKNFLKDK